MTGIDGPYGLIGGFVRARFEPVGMSGMRPRGLGRGAPFVEGWVLLDPGMPQSSITRDAVLRLGLLSQNPRDRHCAFGVLSRTFGYKIKVLIDDFPPIMVDAREVPEATDDAMQFVGKHTIADPTIIGALGTEALINFNCRFLGTDRSASMSS